MPTNTLNDKYQLATKQATIAAPKARDEITKRLSRESSTFTHTVEIDNISPSLQGTRFENRLMKDLAGKLYGMLKRNNRSRVHDVNVGQLRWYENGPDRAIFTVTVHLH
ncbi:hypothetical protein FJZ39_03360 [Candidatus Saccharibacteria bacterium]|nr:hypothetical protein [Candidatus Saccharibacteria bacterium]